MSGFSPPVRGFFDKIIIMKHKIENISGDILQAILSGAPVFWCNSTNTKEFIVLKNPNHAIVPEPANSIFKHHRFALFTSTGNGVFTLQSRYELTDLKMYNHAKELWQKTRKEESKTKTHFN